ncbi:MAG: MoaD/ThiS family protein [Endomicrobia bacterium]|nr:MoaD/ThiS family protein [Endomicrobiia bacterium]MCX7940882.1 MoaD/ThiS family protein [Endomicrobiia bacterium]MDW8055565.1 MoaD/ThiS family protein [Elusimicrobiota bacterium]
MKAKRKKKVTVRFYTILREKVGVDKTEVEAENLYEVIEILKQKFKEPFVSTLCDSSGKVKDYFIFLIDGKTVDHNKFKRTKLKDGQEIHIFPPIAGG